MAPPKPTPPDMAAVVRLFDEPTAALTPVTLPVALAQLALHAQFRQQTRIAFLVVRTVDRALQGQGVTDMAALEADLAAELTPAQVAPVDLRGAGVVRIQTACGFLAEPPSPDPVHGHFAFVVPFTDRTLDPVLWGTFHGCHYQNDGHDVRLDRGTGSEDIRLHVTGDGLTLAAADVVFDLDLRVTVDGVQWPVCTAFRVAAGGVAVEPLLAVDADERVVVGVIRKKAPPNRVDLRAANGLFQCDLAASACTDTATGKVVVAP